MAFIDCKKKEGDISCKSNSDKINFKSQAENRQRRSLFNPEVQQEEITILRICVPVTSGGRVSVPH